MCELPETREKSNDKCSKPDDLMPLREHQCTVPERKWNPKAACEETFARTDGRHEPVDPRVTHSNLEAAACGMGGAKTPRARLEVPAQFLGERRKAVGI